MVTELNKPVSRQIHVDGVGDFVVELDKAGVSIRKLRHRKRVSLTFEQLTARGLELAGWLLTEREWAAPLKTLAKLRRLKTANTKERRLKTAKRK